MNTCQGTALAVPQSAHKEESSRRSVATEAAIAKITHYQQSAQPCSILGGTSQSVGRFANLILPCEEMSRQIAYSCSSSTAVLWRCRTQHRSKRPHLWLSNMRRMRRGISQP